MFTVNTAGAMMKIWLGSFMPAGLVIAAEDQHKLYPLGEFLNMFAEETGYFHIQATKPDTIGGCCYLTFGSR